MVKKINEFYELTIDEQKGEIQSLNLGGKEFISETKLPIFNIRFRNEDGGISFKNTYDGKFKACDETDDGYVISFDSFGDVNIAVKVSVAFGKHIVWRINIENKSNLAIEWVDFPQIAVVNDMKYKGGESRIVWGYNEGAIVEDLEIREKTEFNYKELEYPQRGIMPVYPGIVETQFMGYYDMKNGLYLGCHDRKGNVKGIDFKEEGKGVKLQFRLFSGVSAGEDFDMDYDFVMAGFSGDWHEAAEIYRRWFDENKPEPFVKIIENDKLPEWYHDSPIVVTYPVRGRFDTDEMTPNKLFPYINAMQHIERLAKETDSRIMVILMHWEGSAPWAPPYVWPPYGGEDKLEEFINALHKENHLLGVYCSGFGWTMQSNVVKEYNKAQQFEDESLKEAMCISPTGDLPFSNICQSQRSGYDMCTTHPFTREVIRGEVEKMVEAGIDYVQVLDQNHGGTQYLCYSKNHGHPSMPGKWQTDSMLELLKILEDCTHKAEKKVLLGCESAAAEPFIPYLQFSDNRFNLNYLVGGYPVPVYAYIFHQYVNNFMGNQICSSYAFDREKNKDSLLIRVAHSIIAGDMLTLVITQNGDVAWSWGMRDENDLPDRVSAIKLAKNANAIRRGYGKKYLVYGKMIKPMKLVYEGENTIELPVGSIYHAERLFTSCWMAEDGGIGQIVVNYNQDAIEFYVDDNRNITITRPDGTAETVGCRGKIVINPFETIVIEPK